MEKFGVGEHLELEELVEALVEGDSIQVLAPFAINCPRGRQTSGSVLTAPAEASLEIVRSVAQR